jgi:hypothetical protein
VSTCISRHGEYSDHTPDADYRCTRCHVLDEDALINELVRLRQEVRDDSIEMRAATRSIEEATAIMRIGKAEIDRLSALVATCSCGTSPETYDGPQADCPAHGAIRALAEVTSERDEARAEAERQRANALGACDAADNAIRIARDMSAGDHDLLEQWRVVYDAGGNFPYIWQAGLDADEVQKSLREASEYYPNARAQFRTVSRWREVES